jgi:hypothetical protein
MASDPRIQPHGDRSSDAQDAPGSRRARRYRGLPAAICDRRTHTGSTRPGPMVRAPSPGFARTPDTRDAADRMVARRSSREMWRDYAARPEEGTVAGTAPCHPSFNCDVQDTECTLITISTARAMSARTFTRARPPMSSARLSPCAFTPEAFASVLIMRTPRRLESFRVDSRPCRAGSPLICRRSTGCLK